MRFTLWLAPALLAAIAVPAIAGITTIGSSAAELCYEAAEAEGPGTASSIGYCDEALVPGALIGYELVATHVNRGILRLRRGQLDAAIADFDAAIGIDPDEPEAYLNKGMATLRQPGGWEQAVPLFTTAIAKRTRKPAIAYFGRAVAQEMGGRIRAAYFDYRQASALSPGWREPKVELARFNVRRR